MPKFERSQRAMERAAQLIEEVESYSKAQGLSQFALGAKCGIHERTVGHTFRHKTTLLDTFVSLAHAAGFEVALYKEDELEEQGLLSEAELEQLEKDRRYVG